MSHKYNIIFLLLAALSVSACAQQPVPIDASRGDNGSLYFYNDSIEDGPVIDQIAALNQSADELVRSSRVNGALIGAALGCGLTVLSASNARKCVVGAAVGGAGGAVIGNMAGARAVERRVELVVEGDIMRSLENADNQFKSFRADLPTFLAQQEQELNSLAMQLIRGEIDQSQHDLAVLKIEQDRIDLADALELSARDARQASSNLQDAARRGQTGLDWHIGTASRLADDVESTRMSFSLL